MSPAPAIVAVVKITIDDLWDTRHMAVFGSPENFVEDWIERAKEKDLISDGAIVSVEVRKDQRFT